MRRFLLVVALLVVAVVALPPLVYGVLPRETPELPAAGRRIPVGGGVFVNAVERGEGPPVVLVHGLPGSAYDWAPLTLALAARGRRVLAYDRLGYGHSDGRPDDDFTYEANGKELLALLESEGLRDATVVGWSYGGGVAMEAALEDASRIARLVLVASGGPFPDTPERLPGAGVLFEAAMVWVSAVPPVGIRMQRSGSREAFSDQPQPDWWLPQLLANFASPETPRTWRGEILQFRWDGPEPSSIERPILVIHGEQDRAVPLAVSETLHRLARDAELLVVEGGSHMLPITHPELLANHIVAFGREH